ALYAVVGAGDVALESAKSLPKRATALPKRATALPSLVAGKAQALRGDAVKRIERLAKRGESLVGRNGKKIGSKSRNGSPARKRSSVPAVEAAHAASTPGVPVTTAAGQAPGAAAPLVSDLG
ncbi:MAG: hypothetical protein ACRDJM_07370, partial [Actinomycetota bacterium]